MINGIDVASYQPETYAVTGLDFVFVKATEGTSYINPRMARQAATARSAGLALGFYHFLHPGNIAAQAQYFVDKCASLHGDMLVCDWESAPGAGGASCAEKDAFLREVKRLRPTTHKVGLYCNTDYWLHRDKTSYCADFLWIADPNHPAGHPRIEHPWTFHQHSISGGTDRDVANFASRAALRAWCGYPAPAPAPKPAPPKVPAPPKPTHDQVQDARLSKLESEVSAIEKKLN